MKYELNTPYNFKVQNVTRINDTLAFEVEIEGSLFPVQAYPEQLESGMPPMVSCRIIQDKNKDAYLVQNEVSFYPAIYKPNRKYLFEVVDIKDSYVILQDKYGLFHAMDKDGAEYSNNELIVRCVDIVNDDNYKAHLVFHTPKPTAESKEEPIITPEKHIQKQYPSTIFEQDPPSTTVSAPSNDNSGINKPNIEKPKKSISESISSMLFSQNWDSLLDYFDENLKGAQINHIKKEITEAINNCPSSTVYWEMVQFLLNYDAHIFLGTVAKSNFPHKQELGDIDADVLDNIISDAFNDPDKTKYAIEILKPCGKHITTAQKNYIQEKCASLNTAESFYDLFKLLGLSPDEAVYYLLSLQNNIVAAYTIYKFYTDGIIGNRLNERSIFKSFRPSKIAEYVKMMEASQSLALKTTAILINCNILSRGYCPRDLQKEIADNGLEGFKKYVYKKIQQKSTNNTLSALSRGDTLSDLIFIRELDNYYLLVEQQTGTNVLLDKDFTTKKPSKDVKSQARIVKKMSNNGKTVFIVAQKQIPSMYTFPPLVNFSTILEVDFSERNRMWYPEVKSYTKLLNVEIEERPRFVNYKLRQKAVIIRKIDFFTYAVKILQL